MERSSILMMAAMAIYLLSMVEVSSLAFVPGTHQGTGNGQLRGSGSAGATRHASLAGGAAEPLVGQSATCLRVLAAMLSVSAASLSIRGQATTRSQSRVIVHAKGAGEAARAKGKKGASTPEAKKAALEQPKKKQEAPATEAKKAKAEEPKKKQAEPATEAKKAAPEQPKKKQEAPATEAKKAKAEEPKKEPATEAKKGKAEEPKKEPAAEGKKAKAEPKKAPEPKTTTKEEPAAKEKKEEPVKEKPAPAKEEKKAPPKPKKEKKPSREYSIQEQIIAQSTYEEKFDGEVPMEKVNSHFRQTAYESEPVWKIDPAALFALKDGPAKEQAMARYRALTLASLGKLKIAASPDMKHPIAFFANMVVEGAKAQGQVAEVTKDMLELGKLLIGELNVTLRKAYEGGAGDDELVKAVMDPIKSNNKVVKALITYLISKGRLHQLKLICSEYAILCNMETSLIPVTVKSHVALSSAQKKKVEEAMADGLNSPAKNLKIEYEVDESIMAGLRVSYDFDNPINRQGPRCTLDLDFKRVIMSSLGQEFGS